MICVFDCETIPDADAIRSIQGLEGSDTEVITSMQNSYAEQHNTTFLPLPYHKVVAISAVIGDDFGYYQKVGNFGEGSSDEGAIIRSFADFLNAKNPRLISFNGRSFDLPMLMIRALKHNIPFNAYFEKDNAALSKSKWENYRQRYSEDFHTDLMDSLSSFGAARGLKLDELCKIANIPGKYDVSGDDVLNLYTLGHQEKIEEYCQSDCLNTYWLFLKYELLKGTLTPKDYQEVLKDFLTKLPTQKGYSEIFTQTLEAEIKRCG